MGYEEEVKNFFFYRTRTYTVHVVASDEEKSFFLEQDVSVETLLLRNILAQKKCKMGRRLLKKKCPNVFRNFSPGIGATHNEMKKKCRQVAKVARKSTDEYRSLACPLGIS